MCYLLEVNGFAKSSILFARVRRLYGASLIFIYSKIPILRPPLGLSKSGLKDHFWTISKVVSDQMYTKCRKRRKESLKAIKIRFLIDKMS